MLPSSNILEAKHETNDQNLYSLPYSVKEFSKRCLQLCKGVCFDLVENKVGIGPLIVKLFHSKACLNNCLHKLTLTVDRFYISYV